MVRLDLGDGDDECARWNFTETERRMALYTILNYISYYSRNVVHNMDITRRYCICHELCNSVRMTMQEEALRDSCDYSV